MTKISSTFSNNLLPGNPLISVMSTHNCSSNISSVLPNNQLLPLSKQNLAPGSHIIIIQQIQFPGPTTVIYRYIYLFISITLLPHDSITNNCRIFLSVFFARRSNNLSFPVSNHTLTFFSTTSKPTVL